MCVRNVASRWHSKFKPICWSLLHVNPHFSPHSFPVRPLNAPKIQQNIPEYPASLQNFVQTTLRGKKKRGGWRKSFFGRPHYLSDYQGSNQEPKRARGNGSNDGQSLKLGVDLQQVWVNSLFHGLRCSVPMGTFYQRTHSSQQHLRAIWLTADKHQKTP